MIPANTHYSMSVTTSRFQWVNEREEQSITESVWSHIPKFSRLGRSASPRQAKTHPCSRRQTILGQVVRRRGTYVGKYCWKLSAMPCPKRLRTNNQALTSVKASQATLVNGISASSSVSPVSRARRFEANALSSTESQRSLCGKSGSIGTISKAIIPVIPPSIQKSFDLSAFVQ